MWIIFGTKAKTELVPGGAREEGVCQSCGEEVIFYERRLKKTFDLYFIDLLDYEAHRVMACGACGTLYRTDEAPSGVKLASGLQQAVDGVGSTVSRALRRAAGAIEPVLDDASRSLGPSVTKTTARVGDALGRIGDRIVSGTASQQRKVRASTEDEEEQELDSDPEKADLLRRFAELEKRMKK